MSGVSGKPGRDCPLCPRLKAFRDDWRGREASWFNAPVPCFGPLDARLLIVGLAPGLRGANRTGRPFTGDFAGDLLYETLAHFGFARGHEVGELGSPVRSEKPCNQSWSRANRTACMSRHRRQARS